MFELTTRKTFSRLNFCLESWKNLEEWSTNLKQLARETAESEDGEAIVQKLLSAFDLVNPNIALRVIHGAATWALAQQAGINNRRDVLRCSHGKYSNQARYSREFQFTRPWQTSLTRSCSLFDELPSSILNSVLSKRWTSFEKILGAHLSHGNPFSHAQRSQLNASLQFVNPISFFNEVNVYLPNRPRILFVWCWSHLRHVFDWWSLSGWCLRTCTISLSLFWWNHLHEWQFLSYNAINCSDGFEFPMSLGGKKLGYLSWQVTLGDKQISTFWRFFHEEER